MRLAMLVSAAVIGAAFLAFDDTAPAGDLTWLPPLRSTGSPARPPPRLLGSGSPRFRGAALRERDPDALFEELFGAFLSRRHPEPKWILDRLRAVGSRLYPTLIRQLPQGRGRPVKALRRAAARLILLEAGPEAAPYLLDAVDGGDPSVAAAAAIALHELTSDVEACLPVLIDYLDAPRTWVHDDAAAALRTIDAMGRDARSAIPVLMKLVGIRHFVRRHAGRGRKLENAPRIAVGTYVQEILSDLGADAAQATGDLERALLEGARRATRAALLYEVGSSARTLASLGPRGMLTLVRHLDHDEEMVRRLVAGALLEAEDGVTYLIEATRDRYPLRRLMALAALASRPDVYDEKILRAFIARLKDPHESVLRNAAMGLASLGEHARRFRPAVLKALAGSLRRGDAATRRVCLRALLASRRTTPQVARKVAAILPQLEGLTFKRAVAIIDLSGTRESGTIRTLQAAAHGRSAEERALIAKTLGRLRPAKPTLAEH